MKKEKKITYNFALNIKLSFQKIDFVKESFTTHNAAAEKLSSEMVDLSTCKRTIIIIISCFFSDILVMLRSVTLKLNQGLFFLLNIEKIVLFVKLS